MREPEEEEEVLLLPSDQIRQSVANRNRGSYVARHEQPYEPDNFGGGFRGVPTIHRGSQYVRPEQTIGDDTHCWCGELLNHDWPGKANGRKHPKEGTTMSTTTQVLSRSNLSAYARPIQDFILMAVEKDHLDYKIKNNGTLLFPPDGSTAITVFARNNDRQLRALEQWYRKHVLPSREKPVDDVAKAVEKLAEKVNDPVEHPRPKSIEYQTEAQDYRPAAPVVEPPATLAAQEAEWVPFVNARGQESPEWETNGTLYRCTVCMAEGKSHVRDTPRGMGGHKRGVHQNALQFLHSPETTAKQKATTAKRRQAIKTLAAILPELAEAFDVVPTDNSKQVVELEKTVADLIAERDELRTKLALMKEAFAGL